MSAKKKPASAVPSPGPSEDSAAAVLELSQPPLPAFANALISPPGATWGVYQYAYTCAPGFSGPPLTLVKSAADNSWGRVGGPVACAACAGSTYSLGGGDLQYASLQYTQRPPDDFIDIMTAFLTIATMGFTYSIANG